MLNHQELELRPSTNIQSHLQWPIIVGAFNTYGISCDILQKFVISVSNHKEDTFRLAGYYAHWLREWLLLPWDLPTDQLRCS